MCVCVFFHAPYVLHSIIKLGRLCLALFREETGVMGSVEYPLVLLLFFFFDKKYMYMYKFDLKKAVIIIL